MKTKTRREFFESFGRCFAGLFGGSGMILITGGQQECFPAEQRVSVLTATKVYVRLLHEAMGSSEPPLVYDAFHSNGGCGVKVWGFMLPDDRGDYRHADLVFEVNGQRMDDGVSAASVFVVPEQDMITWKNPTLGEILLDFVAPAPPDCFEECQPAVS